MRALHDSVCPHDPKQGGWLTEICPGTSGCPVRDFQRHPPPPGAAALALTWPIRRRWGLR